jgi:hypothetical protein
MLCILTTRSCPSDLLSTRSRAGPRFSRKCTYPHHTYTHLLQPIVDASSSHIAHAHTHTTRICTSCSLSSMHHLRTLRMHIPTPHVYAPPAAYRRCIIFAHCACTYPHHTYMHLLQPIVDASSSHIAHAHTHARRKQSKRFQVECNTARLVVLSHVQRTIRFYVPIRFLHTKAQARNVVHMHSQDRAKY